MPKRNSGKHWYIRTLVNGRTIRTQGFSTRNRALKALIDTYPRIDQLVPNYYDRDWSWYVSFLMSSNSKNGHRMVHIIAERNANSTYIYFPDKPLFYGHRPDRGEIFADLKAAPYRIIREEDILKLLAASLLAEAIGNSDVGEHRGPLQIEPERKEDDKYVSYYEYM